MINVGKMIASIRTDRGYSQRQLADKLGLSKQAISNYERGYREPDYLTLESIADVLNVPMSMLITREEQEEALRKIYAGYEKSAKENHTILLERQSAYAIDIKHVPIIGETAAGSPIYANREYNEYIDVPIDGRRFDAAVRVTGDSMAPGYNIGDLALVRYQDDVLDGQIAVICLDDEVTLKRIYHMPYGLMLHSDNPKYKPMMISEDDIPNIHLTGRAIGCIRWEE